MACEYCVNRKNIPLEESAGQALKGNRMDAIVHTDGIVFLVNHIAAGYFDITHCPMCGEPLAPIKPLSVDCLKLMSAEPLKHWVWIEIFDPTQWHFDAFSGYYRTISDYTDGEAFCCGWPGTCYSWDYCDYGKTWLAYDRRPPLEV